MKKKNKEKGSAVLGLVLIGALVLGMIGLGGSREIKLQKQISALKATVAERAEDAAALGALRPSGYEGKLLTRLTEGGAEATFNTSPSSLPDGTNLSASNIGDFIVITVNPGGANEEKISASSVSITSSTATWTVINRGLEFGSTSQRTANIKQHAIGEKVIISNDDQFLTTQYVDKDTAQTISSVKTFSSTTEPRYNADPVLSSGDELFFAHKQYVDTVATSGAADANFTTKGLVELGTQGNLNNASTSGSTSAKRVVPLDYFNTTSTATTTVPVTKTGGKISQGFLDLTEEFTFTATTTHTGSVVITAASSTFATTTFTGSVFGVQNIYGDGSDGDVTISATTTLTRDMYYNNLTVTSSISLITGGFRIFVKKNLELSTSTFISHNGGNATAADPPVIGTPAASGSLPWAAAAGAISTGAGSAGGTCTKCLGGTGGAGGSGTSGAGGAAGPTSGTIYNTVTSTLFAAFFLFATMPSVTGFQVSSGAGSGAGDSGNSRNGGAGGGAAGFIWISAKTILNNGTIQAKGGNGAKQTNCAGVTDIGGAGGGGGGAVTLIHDDTIRGTNTISLAGGSASGISCGSGGAGSNGTTGKIYDILIKNY